MSHFSAEHADDVGLGFFEAGVTRADRFADVDLLAAVARERRPEPVTDLVHHRPRPDSLPPTPAPPGRGRMSSCASGRMT